MTQSDVKLHKDYKHTRNGHVYKIRNFAKHFRTQETLVCFGSKCCGTYVLPLGDFASQFEPIQ